MNTVSLKTDNFFAAALASLTIFISLISLASAADPGHAASSIASGTFESGNYTFPASVFVTDYLGIGTTVPGAKLDVQGSLGSGGVGIYLRTNFTGGGGTNNYYGTYINSSMNVSGGTNTGYGLYVSPAMSTVGGTNSIYGAYISPTLAIGGGGGIVYGLRVNPSATGSGTVYSAIFQGGNVGIGTASPQNTLQVNGTANISGATYLGNSKCNSGEVLTADVTTGAVSCVGVGSIGGAVSGAGTTGYIAAWNGTTSINSSAIYQNGSNIGIGTANPITKVNINVSGGLNNSVYIGSGTPDTVNSYGEVLELGGNLFFSNAVTSPRINFVSSGGLGFRDNDNNVVRMIIQGTGNVGIGTATPATKLEVAGDVKLSSNGYLYSDSVGNLIQKAANFQALPNTGIDTLYGWDSILGGSGHNQIISTTGPNGGQIKAYRVFDDDMLEEDLGGTTEAVPFNTNATYRVSVWIRENTTGESYIAIAIKPPMINMVTGVIDNVPDLFVGNLPSTNTWYRLVAYIYPYGMSNESVVQGGIYDTSGRRVSTSIKEFRFNSSASTNNMSLILYSTIIGGENPYQIFFYDPRIEIASDFENPLFFGNIGTSGNLSVSGTANITGAAYLGNSKCASGQVITTDATTGIVYCASITNSSGTLSGSGVANTAAFWNGTTSLTSGSLGWGNISNRDLNIAWTGSLGWGNLSNYNLNTVWTGSLGWGNLSGVPAIVSGAGSSGYIAAWNGTTSINSSVVYQNGSSIGIGTTNPGAKLEVNGNVLIDGVSPSLQFGTNNANALIGQMIGASGSMTLYGASYLSFVNWVGSAWTEGLRIKGGNIGIGTTNPGTKLHVNGTIKGTNFLTGANQPVNDILLPQDVQNYGINALNGSLGMDVLNWEEKVAPTVFQSAPVTSDHGVSATSLINGNVLIATGNNSYGTFVIYDKNGNVVRAPTLFANGSMQFISATTLANGNVVIAYRNQSASGTGMFNVYDSSGTQIKSPQMFNLYGSDHVTAISLTNGNVLIAYEDQGASGEGAFVIYDANGTIVKDEMYFREVAGGSLADEISATVLANGNILFAFQDELDENDYGTLTIFDSDGNEVVDDIVFESARTSGISATTANNGNVFIAYTDEGNSSYGTFVIYDAQGNLVKAPAVFEGASATQISATHLANGNVLITYRDGGNSNRGTFVIYDAQGNLVKAPAVFESGGTQYISATALTNGNFLVAYQDDDDSDQGKFVIYQGSGARFYQDLTVDGNVGIGTTSPAARLEINGSGSSGLSLNVSGDLFVNDTTGYVGIGTTNPAKNLEISKSVAGAEAELLRLTNPNWSVGAMSSLGFYNYDGTNPRQTAAIKSELGSGGVYGTLHIFNYVSSTSTEVVTINASNVGIGTTAPANLLHLNFSSNDTYKGIIVSNYGLTPGSSTVDREMGSIDFQTNVNTRHAKIAGYVAANAAGTDLNSLKFIVSSGSVDNTAMVIKETGNVGIGTTSPQNTLQVNGTANISGAVYLNNSKCASGYVLTADTTTGLLSCVSGSSGTLSGSGATGYIAAWNGTTSINSSLIYQNGSNIGIGTTAPAVKLNIMGGSIGVESSYYIGAGKNYGTSASANDAYLQLYSAATGATTLWNTGDYSMIFGVNNAEVMRLKSGNVGINTTAPTYPLTINTSNAVGLAIGKTADNTQSGISLYGSTTGSAGEGATIEYNGATNYFNIITGGGTGSYTTKLTIARDSGNVGIGTTNPTNTTHINGTLFVQNTTGTAGLIVDTQGRVGIGTTTPAQKLDVAGGIRMDQASWLYGKYSGGDLPLIMSDWSDQTRLMTGYNTNLVVYNSAQSTELFKITNAGNVGIGDASPGYKLEVNGSVNVESSDGTTSYLFVNQSSGNVGIGTVNPGGKLHVANGIAGSEATYRGVAIIESGETDAAANGLELKSSVSSAGYGFRFATIYDGASNDDFRLQSRQASASWSPVLSVRGSNGNVGIGTTAPSAKLEVNGAGTTGLSLNVSGDLFVNDTTGYVGIGTTSPGDALEIKGDGKYLRINAANEPTIYYARLGQVYDMNNALRLYQYTNQVMGANYDGTKVFLVPTAGNVGIGTTSPSAKLEVNGTAGSIVLNPSATIPTINTTGPSNLTIASSGGDVIIVIG
jgi:hypothetical protein